MVILLFMKCNLGETNSVPIVNWFVDIGDDLMTFINTSTTLSNLIDTMIAYWTVLLLYSELNSWWWSLIEMIWSLQQVMSNI